MIQNDKKLLRSELLESRRTFGRSSKDDGEISRILIESDIWKRSDTIFVYIPLSWEIDTHKLIDAAFDTKKTVAVPVCSENEMHAVKIERSTKFFRGKYGVREPQEGEIVSLSDTSLIIVPALAFARDGHRIGRGGGFYDRFLSHTVGYSVGLCYARFLYETLPVQEHDRPVDAIITQEGAAFI